MRTAVWIFGFIFLLVSCYKQDVTYVISSDSDENLTCEIWQAESGKSYTDLQITDSYYLFADGEADSLLYAFEKKDIQRTCLYGLKGSESEQFRSIEFVKSNTCYPSIKDAVWLVENKRLLKQIQCRADSLATTQSILLPGELDRSADYNFTKDEIFGVSTMGYVNSPYYFFNPDSGYYRVDPYNLSMQKYRENRFAYLTNLCVNEKNKVAVSALRFFNSVQFFDLHGGIKRAVSFGEAAIQPQNNSGKTLDFENSVKCFIDIYGTDNLVYCLFDGSLMFDQPSKIVVFKWNGDHVRTIQTDYALKKIAVDASDKYILALASNDKGEQLVLKYYLKT